MSQSTQKPASEASSNRYHLPDWFLQRNVKGPSDINGHVCVCQCKACEEYKKLYEEEEEETEDQPSEGEPTKDEPKPEEQSHTSAEKHDGDFEDAISYAKFSDLRDMVATTMLWRHMRPKDSSVLFRRCSETRCSDCLMEPVHMNDIVGQVAKSLGMGLVSLSFEDLEELGCDFHAQDRGLAASSTNGQAAKEEPIEKTEETVPTTEPSEKMKETTSTTEASDGEGAAAEASADKDTPEKDTPEKETPEKATEETPKETTTSEETTKDEWEADWSNGATFTDHFFAAKSKKWQDEEKLSYSAWRDRTKESYAAIIDGASTKTRQESRPQGEDTAGDEVAPKTRGLVVHFIDCDHSSSPLEDRQKRRVLVRLGELVQERRGKGQDVVLVISSRTLEPGEKLCLKAGASKLSGVTLSIVNPYKQKSEDRNRQRKGVINTRRLRRILETGATQPSGDRLTIEWLRDDAGDDLARYGQELWPIDEIHRAAGQIMARMWVKSQPVITSKHVDSVLKRLGMLQVPKEAEKKDEKGDSGDGETKSDEAAEEADKNPLDDLTLDYYEERFRDSVVKPKDLNVSWDDVILDQDTKEVIQNLVPSSKLEVEASSELLLSQLRIRGCLLYGPPGTGKTHLCRAIASASGSRMLSIDYATVQSSLVGRAEKYIHAAFALAAKLHPCVLFIDEADALFYRRSSRERSWERSATTQFLVEMEGLAQNPKSPLVVVATNRPWDLDEAFLRRLPQKFFIGLPDTASRAAILRLFLKQGDLDPSVDVDGIAAVTKGFSGSDLRSLCAEAALLWKMEQVRLDALCGAVSPALATSRGGPKRLRLDTDHFAAAFEKMQPNKARDNADQLERFTRRYNPVQGELGRGNGGKRYIFNEDRGRNDAFSVRELISRDPPPGEESPANMQLVVWRSAEEVLFPGRVSAQAGEAASPPQSTASPEAKASEECAAAPNDDERPGEPEGDLAEPRAQSVELVSSSEVDAEKIQSALDHQEPHTPETPSRPCEVIDESDGPQSSGPDLPSTAPPAPEAQKTISGADVDLVPLLVTLASVLWYT